MPTTPGVVETPGGTVPAPTPTTASTPAANASALLANTSWALVSWGAPGAETAVIDNSTVTLIFGEAGEVGGNGGCNTYGGSYTIQDNQLVFGELISTLMACVDQGVTEQEMSYLAALQSAGPFEIADGVLVIWYDDGNSVLNFMPAAETAPTAVAPSLTPTNTMTTTALLVTE
ncbi:MAG: META domain-containing protein [Caldilineaceae bacterium]|nr:META domain-containing protein [Caldilineaceae bacterium]